MPQPTASQGTFTAEPRPEDRDAFQELAKAFKARKRQPARERRPVFVIDGREVPVPDTAAELLENVWTLLAAGEEVTLTTAKNEIRTGEAAKLLNVSRQYLVRLCGEGKLPYRVDGDGKHRRLARQDVLAYRRQRDEERRASFREYIAEVAASGEYDIPVTWDSQE